jgi:hypothetical protein
VTHDFTSPPEGAINLGHDTWMTKAYRDGAWVAIHEWHKEGDFYGAGFIPFTGRMRAPVSWEVLSEDPLTLSPSLACQQCGHHGFIRNGRWEPC